MPFHANGDRIRSARRRVGKSQEALAAEAGTTRRHLIRLENGQHQPGPALAERLAAATGRDPSEFRDDDEPGVTVAVGDPFRAGGSAPVARGGHSGGGGDGSPAAGGPAGVTSP